MGEMSFGCVPLVISSVDAALQQHIKECISSCAQNKELFI